MRFPILLASAAALAITACGSQTGGEAASAETTGLAANVDDKSLEEQVLEALSDAPRHGLTKDLFIKGELPEDKAERRKQLLKIAKDYASALAMGRVDPTKVHEIYTIARPKVDVQAGLEQALAEDRYRDWVSSLAPQSDEYRALSEAFVQLVKRTPDLPETDIPAGKTIHSGESDPRVPAIARNLEALGYLPAKEPQQQQSRGTTFTPAMAQALARFQADSGIKSDGVIGPSTLEALNRGPRDRARQLAIALERLRWLERDPPATRIDVNTAATHLDYYRDGRHQERRRVVAGQPGWETPQLGSPIYALVANPDWVVPDSIVEDEISKKSASWLQANNFTKKDGRWVQEPGPDSALGLVKFAMRNGEAIYLHDTPAKALFRQPERHESHGCVRVHEAVEFARKVAGDNGILPKFNEAMAKDEEIQVNLGKEIPVRLMYRTAFVGDNGRVHFVKDVYGWDDDVAEALGYARKGRAKVEHRSGDVGP